MVRTDDDTRRMIREGAADEEMAAARFRANGYLVVLYGTRPYTSPPVPEEIGRAIAAVIHSSGWPFRFAPDLIVATPGTDQFALVEVFRNPHEGKRVHPLSKMNGLDGWANTAPIILLDVTHWLVWAHRKDQWWQACKSNASTYAPRDNTSGDCYAWMHNYGAHGFEDVFPDLNPTPKPEPPADAHGWRDPT